MPKEESFVYVTVPYTHRDPAKAAKALDHLAACVAEINKEGVVALAPAVHSDALATAATLPRSWAYWRKTNDVLLKNSEALWVFLMEGWQDDEGVQHEMDFAKKENIPTHFVDPDDFSRWLRIGWHGDEITFGGLRYTKEDTKVIELRWPNGTRTENTVEWEDNSPWVIVDINGQESQIFLKDLAGCLVRKVTGRDNVAGVVFNRVT